MYKEVILISNEVTFMVNAMIMNLEKNEYHVTHVKPEIHLLEEVKDNTEVFIFYLENIEDESQDFQVYLKDLCMEKDKLLILVGNKVEISSVEKILPGEIIEAKMERPLDMKKLVELLDGIWEQTESNVRKKSILIVDDDITYLKTVKSWLDDKYRVSIVNSGMQAITYMAKTQPDLVLLDYMMPVTDGPQVLRMMKSEPTTSSIPEIFLTGKSDRESIMKVMYLKPEGYLLKTTTREEMIQNIEKFFGTRKYKV